MKKSRIYYDAAKQRQMIHEGYSTAIYWSGYMLDYLRSNYATTLNHDLADWLGVSQRTVIRKARQLGLQKNAEWLTGVYNERRQLAHMVSRSMGYPGTFQKGHHANPAGEFKAGHQLTADEMERKSQSMREWYQRHPYAARMKALKAGETRRANLMLAAQASDKLE